MGYENCCGPGYSVRRSYYSRQEKAQWLGDYAEALEKELKAVRERIEDLKKE